MLLHDEAKNMTYDKEQYNILYTCTYVQHHWAKSVCKAQILKK